MEEARVRNWDVALSVLSGLGGSTLILMGPAPWFERLYRQVKVPMPGVTLHVISLSELVGYCPTLTAFVITAITASVHAWNRRVISIARPLVPIASAAVWVAMTYALVMPIPLLLPSGDRPAEALLTPRDLDHDVLGAAKP
jgi:hypothetical protein